MALCRFTKGTRFEWRSQVFVIAQVLLDDRFLLENQTLGGQERATRDELLAAYRAGTLRFEVRGPNARRRRGRPLATAYTFADFQGLPEEKRAEAWRRYEIIRPLLLLSRAERGRRLRDMKKERSDHLKALRDDTASSTGPNGTPRPQPTRGRVGEADSPSSIKRWIKAFGTGGDVWSLVAATSEQGGTGEGRVDHDIETIIDAVLDEAKVRSSGKPRTSVVDLHATIVARIRQEIEEYQDADPMVNPVGVMTIHRRVKEKGLEYLLTRELSPREEHAREAVMPGPRPTRVNERIEMDQTPLDLMVVDDVDRLPVGRPYLCTAVDGYSRYPWGWDVGFEPDSFWTSAQTLAHGIIPSDDAIALYGTTHRHQSWGVLENAIVDNESCLVGNDMKEACAELGINLVQMPLGQPWMKGKIERYIRTHNQGLLHTLPGTTFSNVVARGDYDPMKHACISLSAFRRMLHIFLLDYYAERPHKGIKGIPARRWEAGERSAYPPCLPHTVESIRIMLRSTDYRVPQHYGIDYDCIRYQSSSLTALRQRLKPGETVKIKVDQGDLGKIYVLDPMEQDYIEVGANAEHKEYATGLSIWKHHIIKKHSGLTEDKVDVYALAAAKVDISRIVAEEFGLRGGRRPRRAHARFLGYGERPAAATGADGHPAALPAPTRARSTTPALPAPVAAILPSASDAGEAETSAVPAEPIPVEPIPATPATTRPRRRAQTQDGDGWGGSIGQPRPSLQRPTKRP